MEIIMNIWRKKYADFQVWLTPPRFKINIFEKIISKIILSILDKYNKKDKGSSELLCFGYHVLAQKVK